RRGTAPRNRGAEVLSVLRPSPRGFGWCRESRRAARVADRRRLGYPSQTGRREASSAMERGRNQNRAPPPRALARLVPPLSAAACPTEIDRSRSATGALLRASLP